jgi:hypothetical protein
MPTIETIERSPVIDSDEFELTAQSSADACELYIPRGADEAPAGDEPFDASDAGLCNLIELILKDRPRLHRLIRIRPLQPLLVGRLLAVSLASFALFGVVLSLVLAVAGRWPALVPIRAWLDAPAQVLPGLREIDAPGVPGSGIMAAPWFSGDAWVLIAAYAIGLVAATGVALPSLYFYCLLSGVRMTMVDVVLHSVKAKAEAAVALMGILPIYVAAAMGVIVFGGSDSMREAVLLLGLILPFLAGLWGTASLYSGFRQLSTAMPPACAERRECFLRRLVLAWSACYSAIMPVMIYTLWEAAGRF